MIKRICNYTKLLCIYRIYREMIKRMQGGKNNDENGEQGIVEYVRFKSSSMEKPIMVINNTVWQMLLERLKAELNCRETVLIKYGFVAVSGETETVKTRWKEGYFRSLQVPIAPFLYHALSACYLHFPLPCSSGGNIFSTIILNLIYIHKLRNCFLIYLSVYYYVKIFFFLKKVLHWD